MRNEKSNVRQQLVPTNRYADDYARWEAVKARDAGADGHFWFSVSTTGVYCYPSCAARRARRENVGFYDTRERVERAGFRPCKRCRPELPTRNVRHAEAVAEACRMIEKAEQAPTLKELAAAAKLSPHYFQRRFKEIAGVTPKQYATAHRAQRVRRELSNGESVTEAIYSAGYNSATRFYEDSKEMLGMNPRAFAKGGPGELIRWEVTKSSLGSVLVGATERGICTILFGENRDQLVDDLTARFPRATLEEADRGSDFSAWVACALAFIERPGRGIDLPLDMAGTAFQQQVWAALREIPAGETTTYRDVADRIGRPKAIRAVAGACAANPIAVVIPCHRVLASDGSLSGYRWGTERKQTLLDREAER
jgi:AraC family transcriptional regulator of adaptative response/methylated-DNA-[protein]-cysteine methyltransferase